MDSPFLLIDGEDLTFFRTLQGLATYVESPDLDTYLAVDCNGLLIELSADERGIQAQRFGSVAVTPVTASRTSRPVDKAMLCQRLASFLKLFGVETDCRTPFEELFVAAAGKAGFSD